MCVSFILGNSIYVANHPLLIVFVPCLVVYVRASSKCKVRLSNPQGEQEMTGPKATLSWGWRDGSVVKAFAELFPALTLGAQNHL